MLSKMVGICGRARHGKGEVAELLKELGFIEVQFSAAVKELLLHVDPLVQHGNVTERLSVIVEREGLDEAKKLPEVRRLLQALGNGAREIIHPDVWVDGFKHRQKDRLLIGEKLVVSDMRYPNEAAIVRDLGGEIWKVVRTNPDGSDFDNGLGELNQNASETAVDDIHPNLTIMNGSDVKDLHHKVRRYLFQRTVS